MPAHRLDSPSAIECIGAVGFARKDVDKTGKKLQSFGPLEANALKMAPCMQTLLWFLGILSFDEARDFRGADASVRSACRKKLLLKIHPDKV